MYHIFESGNDNEIIIAFLKRQIAELSQHGGELFENIFWFKNSVFNHVREFTTF